LKAWLAVASPWHRPGLFCCRGVRDRKKRSPPLRECRVGAVTPAPPGTRQIDAPPKLGACPSQCLPVSAAASRETEIRLTCVHWHHPICLGRTLLPAADTLTVRPAHTIKKRPSARRWPVLPYLLCELQVPCTPRVFASRDRPQAATAACRGIEARLPNVIEVGPSTIPSKCCSLRPSRRRRPARICSWLARHRPGYFSFPRPVERFPPPSGSRTRRADGEMRSVGMWPAYPLRRRQGRRQLVSVPVPPLVCRRARSRRLRWCIAGLLCLRRGKGPTEVVPPTLSRRIAFRPPSWAEVLTSRSLITSTSPSSDLAWANADLSGPHEFGTGGDAVFCRSNSWRTAEGHASAPCRPADRALSLAEGSIWLVPSPSCAEFRRAASGGSAPARTRADPH